MANRDSTASWDVGSTISRRRLIRFKRCTRMARDTRRTRHRVTRLIVAVVMMVLAACLGTKLSAETVGFFPTRPGGASLSTATGILTDYGIGNKLGGFNLKLADGSTQEIFVGYPVRINGVVVTCASPPHGAGCSDWPSTVVLNSTTVTVTYWMATYHGRQVSVSDQIDVGTHALARKRISR